MIVLSQHLSLYLVCFVILEHFKAFFHMVKLLFSSYLFDFGRKERCVDGSVFYDSELEYHWLRKIDFFCQKLEEQA